MTSQQYGIGRRLTNNLRIAREDYTTAAKSLESLQKQGVIKKVSKGVFYKPEQTVFGELKPNLKVKQTVS